MKPKKSLGQHFLHSQSALYHIVAAGDIHEGDLVLEIGPGRGALTEALLAKGARVIAIEKDRELIAHLQELFALEIQNGKLTLLHKDILLFDPIVLRDYNVPYKLIANIPYYITGAIIEQFLSTLHQPACIVLLIQKEVADRIIARDQKTGNLDGKQSVLSIAVATYGSPTLVAKIPPGAFFPPPTVDSAVLLIESISRSFFTDVNETFFFQILKSCFGKKRKQLVSSIKDLVGDRIEAQIILQKAAIEISRRPETLTKHDWKRIAQSFEG